jgi:hypothetical protein
VHSRLRTPIAARPAPFAGAGRREALSRGYFFFGGSVWMQKPTEASL